MNETTQVHDGWDGAGRPMTRQREACGCEWTASGTARLSTCSGHLNAARTMRTKDRRHTAQSDITQNVLSYLARRIAWTSLTSSEQLTVIDLRK